jgi:quercetin dioxygenase-like cupin family protein
MVYSEVAKMEEPVYDIKWAATSQRNQRYIIWQVSPFSSPFPNLEIVYKYKLSNTPDKSILGLKVTFAPGACTPPHIHPGASVAVHVLTGTVLNKMNNEPMTVLKAGESFFEAPGCRHRISDNASKTEEASLLATMFMETAHLEEVLAKDGVFGLTVIDEEYRQAVMEKVTASMGGQGH